MYECLQKPWADEPDKFWVEEYQGFFLIRTGTLIVPILCQYSGDKLGLIAAANVAAFADMRPALSKFVKREYYINGRHT